MKVTVKQSDEKEELTFPCLMICESEHNAIIFMYREGHGTRLNNINEIGTYYSQMWDMSKLKPFHGTITLENS